MLRLLDDVERRFDGTRVIFERQSHGILLE
jgi:hypothetical protein